MHNEQFYSLMSNKNGSLLLDRKHLSPIIKNNPIIFLHKSRKCFLKSISLFSLPGDHLVSSEHTETHVHILLFRLIGPTTCLLGANRFRVVTPLYKFFHQCNSTISMNGLFMAACVSGKSPTSDTKKIVLSLEEMALDS